MPHENHISKKTVAEELLVLHANSCTCWSLSYTNKNLNALTLLIMPGLLSETKRRPIIYMKPMHFKNSKPESMHCHSIKQCCQTENAVIITVNPVISFNIIHKTRTMLWPRWLVTSLSLQRPRFNPRPVHTAHVDKMAVGQFFSKHSGFSCQYQSFNAPCSCSHISLMSYSLSN